jgi:hypothetical protein
MACGVEVNAEVLDMLLFSCIIDKLGNFVAMKGSMSKQKFLNFLKLTF